MHFPVVDYRTMQRGYFAKDVHATQRAGLQTMFFEGDVADASFYKDAILESRLEAMLEAIDARRMATT